MSDIVDLRTGKTAKIAAKPNPQVIEVLQQLLDAAKEGSVQQVAYVWVGPDGLPFDGYTPGGHPDELVPVICGLDMCRHTLLSQMVRGGS